MTAQTLVHVGELTIDDVVSENGDVDWKQAGGGALYSAVGSLVWCADVAITAAVGDDYPDELLNEMADVGLDIQGVRKLPGARSIGLWLLYEEGGARRQLEKAGGGSMRSLDARRGPIPYAWPQVAGVHLAPQSSEGHVQGLAELAQRDAVCTLDIMCESYIDTKPYLDGSALRGVDVFLPSLQEVADVWGHQDTCRLHDSLETLGVETRLVVKRGAEGADVLMDRTVIRVPSVTDHLVDPTGAGDAFCGGFLAGLPETGDPVEAAVLGTVSASFVCQTRGAFAAA
ncbi:MAG: carbohydrate kinase family protein, partial [Nocardioidaceae bacterium]